VARDETAFDLEFAAGPDAAGPENYYVHVRCFAAWEFERDSGTVNGHSRNGAPATATRIHEALTHADLGNLQGILSRASISARERDDFESGGAE
jgi:hypothetical protein